ncbi:hypothetical protein AB0M38_31420 [Streptomyces sp. NPDC051742]|uniref:hypothetical protein n=1 Tax=unclassified Streptomyces TaxID=2593676 RepID=UPI00343E0BDA
MADPPCPSILRYSRPAIDSAAFDVLLGGAAGARLLQHPRPVIDVPGLVVPRHLRLRPALLRLLAAVPRLLLSAPRSAGATDRELQRATADALGEVYFRDGGHRAYGLDVELTDIERIEFEL